MAEYIDIDAPVVVTDTRGRERETTVRHILEMNKGVYTAADVRPVVLCRDCEYFSDVMYEGMQFEYGYCDRWADGTRMNPDDFCSHAAKKEES